MTTRVSSLRAEDIRFPTSAALDGSDAMNADPDYSAAYTVVACDDGREGHAFAFTIGRGNEVQKAAIQTLAPLVVGRSVESMLGDLGEFGRALLHDSQLRWLGPEKGVMQMAIGAVLNAVWDLASRSAGVPLWQLLSSMSPAALADLVDFRYLSDALTPSEATGLLADAAPERQQRTLDLLDHGYPAYATTPGWLGYSDAKMTRLIEQAVSDGFTQIKLKVGRDLAEDIRRLSLARRVVGPGIQIAVDANQRWDRDTAIEWIRALQQWDPWWVEEPTSPDDILAHQALRRAVRPTRIATGEHVHNRVMFKQLLQAEAVDVVQIDAARVAGVHENLAILLLATKYGVPVCPHAGGVGLCEMVQHLSMFDYVAVSGTQEGRAIEWVDHLHEHFEDPAVVKDGRYLAPVRPGFSTRMRLSSRRRFMYPDGPAWSPDPGLPGAPACPSRLSGGTA